MVVLNRGIGSNHAATDYRNHVMLYFILFILAGPIIFFGGLSMAVATGTSVVAWMVVMSILLVIAMAAC